MTVLVSVFSADPGVTTKFDRACGDVSSMSALVNRCTVGGDNEHAGKNEANDADFPPSPRAATNPGDGNALIPSPSLVVVDSKLASELRFLACPLAPLPNIARPTSSSSSPAFGDTASSIVVSAELNPASGVARFGATGGRGDLLRRVPSSSLVRGGVVVDPDSARTSPASNDILRTASSHTVKHSLVARVAEPSSDDMNDAMRSAVPTGATPERAAGVDLANRIDRRWRRRASDARGRR